MLTSLPDLAPTPATDAALARALELFGRRFTDLSARAAGLNVRALDRLVHEGRAKVAGVVANPVTGALITTYLVVS